MATTHDLFVGILASATLSASGETVQSDVVEDMLNRLDSDGDLDSQIERSLLTKKKKAGDFGMEIVGSLLIPVLIEASKGLWAAYLKKISEKAGAQLAELTYAQVAKLVNWLWTGEERSQAEIDFDRLLRVAGSRHGLSPEQVEALVIAVRSPEMKAAIDAQVEK
ncbi:hypothetical protein RHD99_06570 [Buttiauxella selenatireducens]|uniref:Co-chaperone DjlA N-terminal domain-containing protein n=1 Tax=Buttiauxella selenatireducens TaxID=3073902 RepID=A0ABY9SGS7_9ENTR|nr:hypothetical protein [Buttiauxella sp. R73]WMY75606.1 hypothetical protein RHD99_06570 [Buttiauxella sp. R73]